MHFCTAKVHIGGDSANVMVRDHFSPLSWPEIAVLRVLHGDESIVDVEPFVSVKQSAKDERQRLAYTYGEDNVQAVWGGKHAPDEMEAEKVKLKAGVKWMNPLSGMVEETTKDGTKAVNPKATPVMPKPESRPLAEEEPAPGPEVVGDPREGVPEEEAYEGEPEPEPVEETEKPQPKKSTSKKK